MAKMTEDAFQKRIAGIDLTEKEKNILREDVGLQTKGQTVTAPAERERLQTSAYAKVMKTLPPNR